MQVFKDFVAARAKKADLDAQLKEVNRKLAELEPRVIDELINNNIDKISVDGATVYSSSRIYARRCDGASGEDIANAIKAMGLGHIITVNSNSLSSFISDTVKDMENLLGTEAFLSQDLNSFVPEPLKGLIEIERVVKPACRKTK